MSKEEIIKKVNNFQGANREFSQEMGPIVEAMLEHVEANKEETKKKLNAPAINGAANQILALDAEKKPVWVNPAAGSIVDTTLSDQSTNPVQNKVIAKALSSKADAEEVENKFARKDGVYSQMTVGAAETLVGQSVNSEEYLIRPTGGESNEVANGIAEVVGLEGQSCVWNQIVPNNIISGQGIERNFTISIPYSGSAHIFYIKIKCSASLSSTTSLMLICRNSNGNYDEYYIRQAVSTNSERYRYITPLIRGYENLIRIRFRSNDSISVAWDELNIFDLTLLGIDNLTTSAQVEEWLAQHVGTKPYYAYNAGTILSAQTLGIKTYGQNLLNPTTKQAKLIPYSWEENSNVYTIKNIPSGATATFTPDNTDIAETVDISGGIFDITDYGSGILELSAATAETYVCMKWDGTKDDDIVPYEDYINDFDARKVYGKNNSVEYQCYPNGMKSAGSAHDELTAERVIVRQVLINLGDLSWSLGDSSVPNVFIAKNTFGGKPFTLNALVTKGYKVVVNSNWYNVNNKQIRIGSLTSNFGVVIHDNDYNSASSFQAAMDGVFMICELKTPITYTDLIYRDNGIDTPLGEVLLQMQVNNWSMEEQLVTPYTDGNPTSIPATVNTIYSIDAVEAIKTLQESAYLGADVRSNFAALLNIINTNCSTVLGGTFGISENATEKVFDFTFIPNAQPDVEPTNEGE